MERKEIMYKIRGAAMDVYNELGPGLYEDVYEAAMVVALTERGLSVKEQVPVEVAFHGHKIASDMRLDLLVEDSVIVELKSVEKGVLPIHYKQLRTYLRLMNKPEGIIINFDVSDLYDGMRPMTNDRYCVDCEDCER